MMTPILELLADKELPGWLLIKNARISEGNGDGHRITAYDEHIWSTSYEEIKAQIPKPVLLGVREARELALYRFSEEDLATSNYAYDDFPNSLMNEGSDREIFGESWTLFWVVPPDKDEVIKLVCDHLKSVAKDKITPEQISECWESRVERLFVRHKNDLGVLELLELHEAINEELIPAINSLECAPDEDSWDVLNEDVFWDDEEF
ncbi:MAG: hypothetical protein WED33_08005 [Bacteroidia bacterium]